MYSKLLEKLSEAIGARLLIQFYYNNEKYVVEPHLLGRNTAAQDCLFAWHDTPDTKQDTAAGWHCFLLSDITHLKLLEKRFSKPRPGYEPYNNTMSRIYYRI